MLSLDQTRLESAQLKAELGHLSSSKFPGVHAIVTARLDFLSRHERGLIACAQSQAASFAPPPPSEVEEKRQRAIEVLKASIAALRGQFVFIPAWDTLRRDQVEGAIREHEEGIKKLEEQAI